MKQRFGGIQRLYTEAGLKKLAQAHVCVVGIGGVGCWAVEMLARSGVGRISLVDADELCVTNINRQIHAMDSTVGRSKITVMAERVKDINPDCQLDLHACFFMQSTVDDILSANYDYLIDAIDSVKHKVLLLAECRQRKIPVVTVGGAGGKTDPSRIQTADLFKSHGDRLLKKVRQELRKKQDLSGKKKIGIRSIFSDEVISLTLCEAEQKSLKLDCDSGYGTSPTVIGSFGIHAANWVIKELLK